MNTIRSLSPRRKIAALVMTLALVGTAVASLAVVNDSLIVNHNFSVISIDLQANAAQGPLTFTHQFDGPSNRFTALLMSNSGNAELRYSLGTTATGSIAPKVDANTFTAASVAACNAGTFGTLLSDGAVLGLGGGDFGSAAAGQQTGDRILAAGASEVLCLVYAPEVAPNAPSASDTGQQIATFSAESTAGNP